MRNSEIILCNMRLDKEYKNVLNYTQEQMVTECRKKGVYTNNTYSFIRPTTNIIEVNVPYNQAIGCNYIAFQNYDYSNKWFFAFIDDVEYRNNNCIRIKFTVDVWSTFFSQLTIFDSFVIREHTNDDTIGANTVPENIEMGEHICYNQEYYNKLDDIAYVVQTTQSPTGQNYGYSYIGKIPFAGNTYLFTELNSFQILIDSYATEGRSDAIYNAYIIPKIIAQGGGLTNKYQDTLNIPKTYQTANNYTIKNNKLFTYPYNYLVMSNNAGSNNIYHFELFDTTYCVFLLEAIGTTGCSVVCYPIHYGKGQTNRDEGLVGAKFPTLSWAKDNYTNWLTQQAVNINRGTVNSGVQMGLGMLSIGLGNIGGGISQIWQGFNSAFDVASQVYEHSFVPPTVQGLVNNSDINFTANKMGYTFYYYGLKDEYIKIIDNYFTMFGYKVNAMKKPNITGRPYWNYIKISSESEFAYAPISRIYLDEINNIARRGTTIWHSHDNIGNYSLDNSLQ